MRLDLDREHLSALWQRQWPMGPPIAHELRAAYSDRWVRSHSLPGSKRYPETEDEYAVVLDRNNTVLDEFFAGSDVYVVTTAWSSEPNGPECPTRRREVHADGSPWTTIANEADPDPEFHTYTHLYADHRPWQRGSIDGILREIAADALSGVLATDAGLQRIHHPYDGGADVILTTPEERDRVQEPSYGLTLAASDRPVNRGSRDSPQRSGRSSNLATSHVVGLLCVASD